jgi:hypothetical protein
MQVIYTYISETNCVPVGYSVAATQLLLLMVFIIIIIIIFDFMPISKQYKLYFMQKPTNAHLHY